MEEVLLMAAKDLGCLALENFCPRCFWIRKRMNRQVPFNHFPGVFSHLDNYQKRLIQGWVGAGTGAPPWLKPLGDIVGYVAPPKAAKFFMPIVDHVVIRGEADCILKRANGELVIIDNKTAVYKGMADPFYPQYRVQLNAYAAITTHQKMGKVGGLALLYAQPCSDEVSALAPENRRDDGFVMNFSVQLLPVPMDPSMVVMLAKQAWDIYSETKAPKGIEDCPNCASIDAMIAVAQKVVPTVASYRAIGCL